MQENDATQGLRRIADRKDKKISTDRYSKSSLSAKLNDTRGQGTTEYAILVGVLVVIAIIAIIAFKDNIQALWDAIQEGINSL